MLLLKSLHKAETEKVGVKKREANASLFFLYFFLYTYLTYNYNVLMYGRYSPYGTYFLSTGKDIWDLKQTLCANGFAFKVLDLDGFTTENTGLELLNCVGRSFKGDNDS